MSMTPTCEERLSAQYDAERAEKAGAAARRNYRIDEQARYAAKAWAHQNGADTLPVILEFLQAYFPNDEDAALFIPAFLRYANAVGKPLDAPLFVKQKKGARTGMRLTYVRNRYTEAAYSAFSERLEAPTVFYSASFAESAAAVRDGAADGCILPWRDAFHAPLQTFFDMIEQYGLFLLSVCAIPDGEGGRLLYALCGNGMRLPENAEDVWVTFFLPAHGKDVFLRTVAYCESIGGNVVYAEARPDLHTLGTVWRVTLRIDKHALAALLLYLSFYDTEAEILGICPAPFGI